MKKKSMKIIGAEEDVIKFLPWLKHKNVGMFLSVGGSSAIAEYELKFWI